MKARDRFSGLLRAAAVVVVLVGAALPAAAQDSAAAPAAAVQALQVVDCLLPGQVRVVGGRTYLTPRRPTRTTAADCAARGGEYLAYDRADYRSALAVWLPAAEQGDAGAQTLVGEIYERGVGGEPNHAAAAEWYRRAAEQGSARAQFNLGTLYEQGLGVGADKLEALNWYRRASGLGTDSLIFRSAAVAEQQQQRSALLEQIEQRDRQLELLQRQVEELNRRLEQASEDADVRAELASLRALIAQVEADRRAEQQALEAIAAAATTQPPPSRAIAFEQPEQVTYRSSDFGRFYALLIGVQSYELLDDLASPANDVERIAAILEDRYGFSVISLANPDQLTVMRVINQLNETLRANDNLLIYFSGHGSRLQSGNREVGYWLPTNAEPPPDDTLWVPNDFVSRHLGRIDAQRVLVIADSCYAGLLGDDPGYVMVGEGSYSDEYIEWKRPKRSRLVISSGSDGPVVDEAQQMHSVFARALLETLETNEQVLTAPELFLRVRNLVRRTPGSAPAGQAPELKALKDAGHEVGDFFFVPIRG
jgi:TPR repeat protein